MDYEKIYRDCMATLDVAKAREVWKLGQPQLPQPKNDAEMLIQLHLARTDKEWVPFKLRAYSHAWLRERDLPSLLPMKLRPKAEQDFPLKFADGVGISVNVSNPIFKPAAVHIQSAMEQAVLESYGDGVTDPFIVKKRMNDARDRALLEMFGRFQKSLPPVLAGKKVD